MSIKVLIDPTKCVHNKFQPISRRVFADADLTDLESIKTRGLDYPIIVYELHSQDRRTLDPIVQYVVMDGWRRTSAWLRWHPGESIPADVRTGVPTDRELFETAVIANEGRQNLNAIQKSDLLAQGIELGMTQSKAGRLFNPPIQQTAVSHLLSLRKLPDSIKTHIESGAIPERIARQLVTPAKHMQPDAIKAAAAIAKAKPEDRDSIAHNEIHRIYANGGKALSFDWVTPWKLNWPTDPLDAPDARPDKGEPTSIPACTDCPFNVEWSRNSYCMRPACHTIKLSLWKAKQAEKQPAGAPATSKRQPSYWERKEKERRKQLNLHNKQSRALVEAATPAIAKVLPAQPVVLDLMFQTVKVHLRMSNREAERQWKAANLDQRRAMIANVLIAHRIGLNMWSDIPPAKSKSVIEKLARALEIKLPPHWSDPPAPARPTPKPRATRKGRKGVTTKSKS